MENQNNSVKSSQSEFDRKNCQNQKLSCKSRYYELPKLLGIIGSGIILLWALPDLLLNLPEGIFFGTLIILPAFLGLIGAIKVENRPITSGFLMFIGGWIYLVFPLTITLNPILLFSGLFLLLGGVLTMKHTKEILAMNGKDLPKYYRKIKILAKILTIIFCFLLFVILLIPDTSRDKANNAKIKSDLSQMMLAVEMYYSDAVPAAYPANLAALSPAYIQKLPTCPGGCIYTYSASEGISYSISAPLFSHLLGITWICSNGSCYEEQKKE